MDFPNRDNGWPDLLIDMQLVLEGGVEAPVVQSLPAPETIEAAAARTRWRPTGTCTRSTRRGRTGSIVTSVQGPQGEPDFQVLPEVRRSPPSALPGIRRNRRPTCRRARSGWTPMTRFHCRPDRRVSLARSVRAHPALQERTELMERTERTELTPRFRVRRATRVTRATRVIPERRGPSGPVWLSGSQPLERLTSR